MTSDRPAAIYVRLSKPSRGGKLISLETQEDGCRELARQLGLEVGEVFREVASASKYRTRQRPEWDRLQESLAGFGAVIAWTQDRLGREEGSWFAFADACEAADVQILTCDGSLGVDLRADRVSSGLKSIIGAEEARKISMRVREALARRAADGDAHGGPRPYGYARPDEGGLVVIPEEADVIREAAHRVLAGESLGAVVTDLQRRGIVSARGGDWRSKAMKGVLVSARVAGFREVDGEFVQGDWEPILGRDDVERLRRRLTDPARRLSHPRPPRTYFLSGGLLRCGLCGAKMKGRTNNSRTGDVRKYICPPSSESAGCGRLSITAGTLEDEVRFQAFVLLASPELRAALATDEDEPATDALYARLRDLEQTGELLTTMLGRGEVSQREYIRARDANVLDRRALERELQGLLDHRQQILVNLPTTLDGLADWWATATTEKRHALIAAGVDHIEIAPGLRGRRGFQQGRVAIYWHDGRVT